MVSNEKNFFKKRRVITKKNKKKKKSAHPGNFNCQGSHLSKAISVVHSSTDDNSKKNIKNKKIK